MVREKRERLVGKEKYRNPLLRGNDFQQYLYGNNYNYNYLQT